MLFQILFGCSLIVCGVFALLLLQAHRKIKELEAIAFIDPLTKVGNRRKSAEEFARLSALYTRHKKTFSVAIIDIDDLKKINDTCGHGAGDRAIKEFASALRDSLRASDTVVRFGGDEFLVFLPETKLQSAELLMKRFCEEVLPRIMVFDAVVTASVGIGEFSEADLVSNNPARWFTDRIDKALYRAKKSGKNCVALA